MLVGQFLDKPKLHWKVKSLVLLIYLRHLEYFQSKDKTTEWLKLALTMGSNSFWRCIDILIHLYSNSQDTFFKLVIYLVEVRLQITSDSRKTNTALSVDCCPKNLRAKQCTINRWCSVIFSKIWLDFETDFNKMTHTINPVWIFHKLPVKLLVYKK